MLLTDQLNDLHLNILTIGGIKITLQRTEESEHRLYYEFVEFTRIIDEVDLDKARAMLEISLTVSGIMEEARLQEGIVFANDEQYAVV